MNQKGIDLTKSKRYDRAIDAFKAATAANPNEPAYWNNLGVAYLTLGEHSSARSAFKRAVKADPYYATGHYNLGAVEDLELNYDAAIESYARAIELDPGMADPAKNPLIVNNTHMAAINLTLYKRGIGAAGSGLDAAGTGAAPPAKPGTSKK